MFDDQIVNQKGKRIPLNPEDHSFIGVAQLGVVVVHCQLSLGSR